MLPQKRTDASRFKTSSETLLSQKKSDAPRFRPSSEALGTKTSPQSVRLRKTSSVVETGSVTIPQNPEAEDAPQNIRLDVVKNRSNVGVSGLTQGYDPESGTSAIS